jgi:hypothetical protein
MNPLIVETGMEAIGFTFSFFNWYGFKHPSPSKIISNSEVVFDLLLVEKRLTPPENKSKFISNLLKFMKKEGYIIKENNAKLSASSIIIGMGVKAQDILGTNPSLLESLPKDSNLYGYLSGVNRDTFTKVFFSKITEDYLNEVRRVVFKRGLKNFNEMSPSDVDDFINDFIIKCLDRDLLKSAILKYGSITPEAFGYWCVKYATYVSKYHRKHRTLECFSIDDVISSSSFHNPVKDYEHKEAIIKFLELLEEQTEDMKESDKRIIHTLIKMKLLGSSSAEIKESIPSAWYWSEKIKTLGDFDKSDFLD